MLIKGSFKQQNILWEVYFKSDLYPEVSLEIGSSPDGIFGENQNFQVYFSSDAVEVTTESPEDTFQPIIKHSATVNLLTKTYIGQYFWSESPLDIRVEIFRNKEIIFSGFVTQGSYSQSYADCYDELNISCVDYLSVLEYYNYADISHNYDSYKTSATNVSFQKIFNNLLIDGLDFHLGQKSSLYYDQSKDSVFLKNTIFDDIEFSELNFLGDDEDSVDTKEDVLSKILTYLNLHIVQLGKDYLIFDWDFINNVSEGLANYIDLWNRSKTFTKSLLTSPDYPELIKRFHYSSSSTNLSIADVYNKIQVNCALDSTDDAIVSPFDEEITTQVYPKKYLYQTEVLSPGKGFGDAKEFLDYVKNNDKSVDDDFTVIDYYIQQISNPSWTLYGGHDVQKDFTVVHQDILKYVPYNSKGEPYKAYYIPSEFPERFGVTALYSIGCIQKKQEDINKDMSKVSPNSLQMSPYIVISVNGNGDDSENGHKPTDQDIIDAVPIAEYTGNISGGVYSPTDDDTTNYMIFSGKIMYVPRTWSELTFVWDVVKQVDNFASLLNYTVPYFKDEGKTFRTNKFYTVDNPTSIQDDSVFDGSSRDFTDYRRSPYLDLSFANSQDKVKWFKYNYTRLENGDASSIDNINKLSVFECQLIIGDKTFVETVNSDGSSTYSWEAYNPAYDKTVNQQSFTLGIDPNKGDYILGQDFEIENNITFDMNLGSNKGFAIPIKKSDNLKGNIVFKILGPFQLQWNDITKRHKTMFRHTKYTDHYKYILANCSSIVIKDFNCKLISDNSGLEVNNEKDLIYVSTEDKKFTNSYETDFDITSGLSSQECYEKQINNKIYMNYPVTTKGEVVTKIVNKNYQLATKPDDQSPIYLQDKPEKFYIDQYFREYSKPRIIFQVPVREKLFTNKPMIDLFGSFVCFQTFRDKSFKLIGIDYSSDDETPRNLTFKELPEEFGKPADDYDWTDNSETGGDNDSYQGGINESIDCDHAKIADYFTITNTGSGNYYLIITINSTATQKHFYYTTDDIKWVKSTGNLEINLKPGDKIRLRCIFKGNTKLNKYKPYLTFSNYQSDEYVGINVSGDIQSLSAGDDFKNQQNLATYCNGLFSGKNWTFNGLVLSSKNLSETCYQRMFENCTNLTNIPELPAQTLKDYCYSNMFSGCTKLTKTGNVSWTNTASRCCEYMFMDCTGLINVSDTIFSDNVNLTRECYWGMFQDCTNIYTVRILKKVLPDSADSCFGRMFAGCSKLSEIVYYCDNLGGVSNTEINHTFKWVDGVSSTGTWYNANQQTFANMSDSEIPNGWVIKEGEVDQPVDPNTINDYFTFTNNNTSTSVINLNVNVDLLYYSYDDIKWKPYNNKENLGRFNITLAQNSKVRLKAINTLKNRTTFDINSDLNGINISGNIQTLSAGDDYKNQQNKATYCKSLFYSKGSFTIDGLTLGAATLTPECYSMMFSWCTNLTSIPEGLLPATTLAPNCYKYMFSDCRNLTSIPEGLLPATTLAPNCYEYMFENCANLTSIPEDLLPATTLEVGCYSHMFSSCDNLTSVPKLPATTLAPNCYSHMFDTCDNLTSIPAGLLPATTLTPNCYEGMFTVCYNLTSVPEGLLPATTLAPNCYKYMFSGCSCLTSVPKLPATTLAPYCYEYMFNQCPGLKSIPEGLLPATTLAPNCYEGMFRDINLETIPAGLLPATTLAPYCYSHMFALCGYLTSIPAGLLPATTLVNNCYEYMFTGCDQLKSIPQGLLPATTLAPYCYSHMFEGSTLETIHIDRLPATTLSPYCYSHMFDSCRLKNISRYLLPATNLANNCYEYMFANNFYITYTPSLPAENLADDCYKKMFQFCGELSSVSFGGETIGLQWTLGWLEAVSKKGKFYYSCKWLNIVRGDYAVPFDWDIIALD